MSQAAMTVSERADELEEQMMHELNEKIEDYLNNGFRLVWVIHPNTRTVTIYRGDRSVTVLHEQDEITGEGALPSFRCKVHEFFTA